MQLQTVCTDVGNKKNYLFNYLLLKQNGQSNKEQIFQPIKTSNCRLSIKQSSKFRLQVY